MVQVSVIVTTFNRKIFLTETLNSILNQTFKDFELIIVDNYSDYNFIAHINSFNDKRIRVFQNQNNGIIAVNRNFGIKKAKGKYLAFCDDDDIWFKEKLDHQINKIRENGCDLVSSNMILFKNNIENIIGVQKNRLVNNLNDLLKQNQINTSSVLVKRTELVFFNCDETLVTIEDHALWINLYINGFKFGFINEPMIYYRINDSMSYKNRISQHLRSVYLLLSIKIKYPKQKVFYPILVHMSKYIIKKILFFFQVKKIDKTNLIRKR